MRPKLFFQALLGIVSVGAIIMIMIVYFFGDNQTKVVEKVVEKEVIVYRDAPAAVTPAENYTVVQQPAAPAPVAPVEVAAAPAAEESNKLPYGVPFDEFYQELKNRAASFEHEFLTMDINSYDELLILTMDVKQDTELRALIDMLFIDSTMGGESLQTWNAICSEMDELSLTMRQRLIDRGYDNKHASVRITDGDTLLYTTDDGVKTFDFFELFRGNNGNT